jgi:PhnB protein
MPVKPIPDGYHAVTPYLIIDGAAQALDFYQRAFGMKEAFRMPAPGGKIGHAEMRIGDSVVMLADEFPEMGHRSPKAFGGSAVSLMVYVDNVDEVFKRALAAGAKQLRPVENQFYGDRSGMLQDPFGHVWNIATHVEDVSEEELARRAQEMSKKYTQT